MSLLYFLQGITLREMFTRDFRRDRMRGYILNKTINDQVELIKEQLNSKLDENSKAFKDLKSYSNHAVSFKRVFLGSVTDHDHNDLKLQPRSNR